MAPEAFQAMQVLKELWTIDRRIDEAYERIAQVREMAMKATSSFKAVNISGTGSRSRIEDAVIRMDQLEKQLDTNIDRMTRQRTRCQHAIDHMDGHYAERERRMLELRYIDHRSWADIMRRMHFEASQSKRIHEAALCNFWRQWSKMDQNGPFFLL